MRKAQGALEYLIIIAAVLAIAAIVVLFITGAYKGASGGGDISKCRLASANCANSIATGAATACVSTCVTACADATGKDVIATGVAVSAPTCIAGPISTSAIACYQCSIGNTTRIAV